MSYPFGDLLSQHLHRKHGLSQAKLAVRTLQDSTVINKMGKNRAGEIMLTQPALVQLPPSLTRKVS